MQSSKKKNIIQRMNIVLLSLTFLFANAGIPVFAIEEQTKQTTTQEQENIDEEYNEGSEQVESDSSKSTDQGEISSVTNETKVDISNNLVDDFTNEVTTDDMPSTDEVETSDQKNKATATTNSETALSGVVETQSTHLNEVFSNTQAINATSDAPISDDTDNLKSDESSSSSTSKSVVAIAASKNDNVRFIKSPIPYTIGDITTGKWDYVEYTGTYNYEIQIVYKEGLPEASQRQISIHSDAFVVGDSYIFEFDTYSLHGGFIKNVQLSEDKKVLTYTVDNDALKGVTSTLTFSLTSTDYFAKGYNRTDYYKDDTLASNIGVMLLAVPNGRVGVKITEGDDVNNSITLEHELKRDNHDEVDITTDDDTYVSYSSKNPVAGKTNQDLYLGSDGFLYFKNADGTMEVKSGTHNDEESLVSASIYYYLINMVNVDHAPIGDVDYNFRAPSGFTFVYYESYIKEYYNYSTATIDVNSKDDSVTAHRASQTNSLYSSYGFASNFVDSNLQQMFTGIVPSPSTRAFAASKITGNSTTSPYATNKLFKYTEESYTARDTEISYKQVVFDEDTGKYIVVDKKYVEPGMTVHIPEYTYKDLISMEASVPEKVNEEDPADTKYHFAMYNNVTSYINEEGQQRFTNENVRDNIAPYFHNDGTMTIEFNDPNFTPSHLQLRNEYNEYRGYTIHYKDGRIADKVSVLGEINIPIDGKEVSKIVFNISSNGLIESGRASGYQTGGYFYGEFTRPTGTNSIRVDVVFESKGNGPESLLEDAKVVANKKITWEYENTVDSLHVYQNIQNSGNLFINNSYYSDNLPELQSGFAIPMEVGQSSITYRDFKLDLFDTTHIDEMSISDEEKETRKKNVQAVLSQLGYSYRFIGDNPIVKFQGDSSDKVWIEYTTNLNPEVQVKEMVANETKTYSLYLTTGEYFTSMVFRADYIRLFGADDEYESTNFDVVSIIDSFAFRKTRQEDGPMATPNQNINILAKASATGLTNEWIPKNPDDQVSQSRNKTLSNSYYGNNSIISLSYEKTMEIKTQYTTYSSTPTITLPENAAAASVLPSGNIKIPIPAYSSISNSFYSSNIDYPEGTYMYLQLNTNQFKYVGDDYRITEIEHDGSTWLKVDISEYSLKSQSYVYINNEYFAVTSNVGVNNDYSLFLESYVDIAAVFLMDKTVDPFLEFTGYSNLNTYGLEDVRNLKSLSDVKYDGKRFVQVNTNQKIFVNTSSVPNIILYPGIENKVSNYQTTAYNANDFNMLNLNVDVGSPNRSFKNYHLVVTLPRKGERYTNETMDEVVESDLSLYLRSLDPSNVVVSDNITTKYTVNYASEYQFDKTNNTNSVIDFKSATTIENAKYVIISFEDLPFGTIAGVEVRLQASKEDMYTSDHQYTSYASVEARYEYADGTPPAPDVIYNVADGFASRPAQYIFEWYSLRGIVFEDGYSYTLPPAPDGLRFSGAGDNSFSHQSGIDFLNLNEIDEDGNPTSMYAPFTEIRFGQDKIYELLIQPKEVIDGKPNYSIAVDLDKLTPAESYFPNIYINTEDVTYTRTLNTSEMTDFFLMNNNAPRIGGIEMYASADSFEIISTKDTTTREIVPLVTEKEFELGYVNFGVHRNPGVKVDPSIVEVKVGEKVDLTATITGVGTYKENEIYNPIDGNIYSSVDAKVSDNEQVANIELTGDVITYEEKDNKYIYKNATTTILNAFGEEITVTNQYLVYQVPYVTFHQSPKDNNELAGIWNDSTITDTNVKVSQVLENRDALEGTILNTEVPKIEAPNGYIFSGWQTASGEKVVITNDTIMFDNFENIYPIFESVNVDKTYNVHFEINKDEGNFGDDVYYKEEVKSGSAAHIIPIVKPLIGYEFVGWYQKGDTSKTLIDPQTIKVVDRDLYFVALLNKIPSIIPKPTTSTPQIPDPITIPSTGDNSNITIVITMLIISVTSILFMKNKRKYKIDK